MRYFLMAMCAIAVVIFVGNQFGNAVKASAPVQKLQSTLEERKAILDSL